MKSLGLSASSCARSISNCHIALQITSISYFSLPVLLLNAHVNFHEFCIFISEPYIISCKKIRLKNLYTLIENRHIENYPYLPNYLPLLYNYAQDLKIF